MCAGTSVLFFAGTPGDRQSITSDHRRRRVAQLRTDPRERCDMKVPNHEAVFYV